MTSKRLLTRILFICAVLLLFALTAIPAIPVAADQPVFYAFRYNDVGEDSCPGGFHIVWNLWLDETIRYNIDKQGNIISGHAHALTQGTYTHVDSPEKFITIVYENVHGAKGEPDIFLGPYPAYTVMTYIAHLIIRDPDGKMVFQAAGQESLNVVTGELSSQTPHSVPDWKTMICSLLA